MQTSALLLSNAPTTVARGRGSVVGSPSKHSDPLESDTSPSNTEPGMKADAFTGVKTRGKHECSRVANTDKTARVVAPRQTLTDRRSIRRRWTVVHTVPLDLAVPSCLFQCSQGSHIRGTESLSMFAVVGIWCAGTGYGGYSCCCTLCSCTLSGSIVVALVHSEQS